MVLWLGTALRDDPATDVSSCILSCMYPLVYFLACAVANLCCCHTSVTRQHQHVLTPVQHNLVLVPHDNCTCRSAVHVGALCNL